MIGFSLVPLTNETGLACTFEEPQGAEFFFYRRTDIQLWLDKLTRINRPILVNDARRVYRSLSFLGYDYLQSLRLFDIKAFLNTYRNMLDINIYEFGNKNYGIDAAKEFERIKKIWMIQGETENWQSIPHSVIQVFIKKEAEIAYKAGTPLVSNVTLPIEASSYFDFLRDFTIAITFLEKIGVTSKTNHSLIIPKYEYDRAVTGRILNLEPFCFQTKPFEDFCKTFGSRFGPEGMLVSADWANADFRVAAALAQEKVEGEKRDPYSFIGKILYNKDQLTESERSSLKQTVLSVMYGYEDQKSAEIFAQAYPRIIAFKKWVIKEAEKKKKLTTYLGKSRYFEDRDKFETKAFNTINQMTVADLCKKAVIEMQKVFKERGLKSTPIPWVCYDSFGFDVYLSEKEQALSAIRESLIDRTIPSGFRQFCEWDVRIKNSLGETI